MEALLPRLLLFACINMCIILFGYWLIKKTWATISWLLLLITVLLVHLVFLHDTPIWRMLAIIATTFTGMKVIAVAEGYRGKRFALTFKQWFVFASGWVGMRAQPFETLGGPPLPNAWPMVRFGISRIVAGLSLILLAHGIVRLHFSPNVNYVLVSVVLLVGFSLILHFGLLNISAGALRLQGATTYLLFRQPAKALSLTEFWGKRWNIAFSEMTSVAIYRPLRNKVGSAAALMLSFIFSGLLHELALSVPVNAGYGLPTLYFVLQGVVVHLEKFLAARNPSFLKNTIAAHAWVFIWVVVPAPLLFHTHFIKQVVWVLAGM